ncbi:FtsQ-type POTRA domain-containing protein [Roseofilum sp. BLCC_M154]|uniref:FtsQ-type POTRA domain-containing protein n=1 Tax=Roseofilum acuticapitatum BLCC-M154 TaxID=3022444 RepID=A0ABT7AYL0_9CYAN|nr:FtsQ-type POTRA domain-containing protein [Roseofilum acuticapitatum]MDJ1171396.1 FtsQ-type POTRA domain-containing protein [Roseofilum acuticapitatum BLCC-M154]
MTLIQPISKQELLERRRKLRQKQRLKLLQTLWQTVAVGAIAYGGGWLLTQPNWAIRDPEQVVIRGNELLTTEALRELLPIKYPQSLFRVQPHEIAQTLEAKGPIAQAQVTRQLLPLRLTIEVSERKPVAIAMDSGQSKTVGLIDEQGIWMPLESYTQLTSSALPTLKIIGPLAYYQSSWAEIYGVLKTSPVQIMELNWEDPKNLILTTELGKVHLGVYTPQLAKQLQVLDRMRQLPQQIPPGQMNYIDLRNPDDPSIEIKSSSTQYKPFDAGQIPQE